MNDDDYPSPSHFMIQPSQQVWSTEGLPNLNPVWRVGCVASATLKAYPRTDRARCARPHYPPVKLDSDKFGNPAADQTCWLG